MKHGILALACSVAVGAAVAGETFYWRGGSGTWSEISNWSMDSAGSIAATRYPGSDAGTTDDTAWFTSSANGTITLDRDVTIYRLYSDSVSVENTNPLTFTSDGTIRTITSTSTENSANHRTAFMYRRKVYFNNIRYDGAFLDFRHEAHLGANTTVNLTSTIYSWYSTTHVYFDAGSTVTAAGSCLVQAAGAQFTFNGGTVTLTGSGTLGSGVSNDGTWYGGTITFNSGSYSGKYIRLYTNMVLNVSGGTLTMTAPPSVDGSETVNITGGKIIWNTGTEVTDRRWLGTGNTILDYPYERSAYGGVTVLTPENPDLAYSGTLYVTNGTYGSFHLADGSTLTGTGTMYLQRIRTLANATAYVSLGRIVLGRAIHYANSGAFYFENQAFGSYGDWGVGNSSAWGYIYLLGNCQFDTTDAFDGETGHTITLLTQYPMPDAKISVVGNGTLLWKPSYERRISEVSVGAGATFSPGSKYLWVGKLTLGANAKLNLKAGTSSTVEYGELVADPSAQIAVTVPSGLTDYAYPVVDTENPTNDLTGIVSLISKTGAGAGDYSLQTDKGVAYLRSGTPFTVPSQYTTTNFWTGASTAGRNFSDPDNWYLGITPAPAASARPALLVFGGYDNLVVTNDFDTSHCHVYLFAKDCGPTIIRGNALRPHCWGYGYAGASFQSLSPFPQTIETVVNSGSTRISASSDGGSTITFTTNVYASQDFFVMGHVRLKGKAGFGGGFYFRPTASGSRPTLLELMPGATLSVSNQNEYDVVKYKDYGRKIWDKEGAFYVHKGARVEFLARTSEAMIGRTYASNLTASTIDGEFDVQCPLVGTTKMVANGTGSLNVESTITSNGNASVVLGGGITFTSGGFRTVTEEDADHLIKIVVDNGVVNLSATKDWTYGPQVGLETSTTAADRALTINPGATLRLTATGLGAAAHRVSFADPIVGQGTLEFAPGAQIGLAGDLKTRADGGAWTTVATVGAVTGTPQSYGYVFRRVPVANGVALQAKRLFGMTITIR